MNSPSMPLMESRRGPSLGQSFEDVRLMLARSAVSGMPHIVGLRGSTEYDQILEKAAEARLGLIDIMEAGELIGPHINRTPLEQSEHFSAITGNKVWFKREDQQPVHSFKLRGALNLMLRLTPEEKEKGVIAASAGNHAQGVAYAARLLGIDATIVMPEKTPKVKVDAVEKLGANIILKGDNYSQANEHLKSIVEEDNRVEIPPFDHEDVINGQATMVLEILEKNPDTTHIFVPGGGGGLAAGVAEAAKALKPDIKVIVVEPEDSNAIQLGFKAGRPVKLETPPGLFADGVAVEQVGKITLPRILKYVDECITVSKVKASETLRMFINETKSILEPAGAISAAGLVEYAEEHGCVGENMVAVCTGANIDAAKLSYALELAERVSDREALFAVKLIDEPGSLRNFCKKIVKKHGTEKYRSIKEFHFGRSTGEDDAVILIGLETEDAEDRKAIIQKMNEVDYEFTDHSDDEIMREHGRDMFGASRGVSNRTVLRINLPERAGSLINMLDTLDDEWNISLFHYRSYGSEIGEIVVGFDDADADTLSELLKKAGYKNKKIDWL